MSRRDQRAEHRAERDDSWSRRGRTRDTAATSLAPNARPDAPRARRFLVTDAPRRLSSRLSSLLTMIIADHRLSSLPMMTGAVVIGYHRRSSMIIAPIIARHSLSP